MISHAELSKKLSELEKKYDSQFKVVFQAIDQLMVVPEVPPKKTKTNSISYKRIQF